MFAQLNVIFGPGIVTVFFGCHFGSLSLLVLSAYTTLLAGEKRKSNEKLIQTQSRFLVVNSALPFMKDGKTKKDF